jgi:hypothetical protein
MPDLHGIHAQFNLIRTGFTPDFRQIHEEFTANAYKRRTTSAKRSIPDTIPRTRAGHPLFQQH